MSTNSHQYLIFSLLDELYAIELSKVAEVCDPPDISPIPFAPECYSGAFNFHGNIVAIINLPTIIGLPQKYVDAGKLIVLEQEIASIGFFVDFTIKIIPEEQLSFVPTADNKYSSATLHFSDCKAILLNTELLILAI